MMTENNETSSHRIKHRFILFAVILICVGAGGWLYKTIYTRSTQNTVVVSRSEIIRAVYATGAVEPVSWTVLSPEKTGRLVEIIHNEGRKITKGDVVARMESRVVEERLHEAQARLTFARKEVERKRTLVKSGTVSRSNAEDAEREFDEAQQRVHVISRELDDLKLIAPVDGIVLRREAEVGETVQAGEPAFWVGSPKPLRVTADVDEEDIDQVKFDQTALIKTDAFPDQVFEGKVNEITPQGDKVNKVFRVRISLPDDVPLMINMTTEVNIITERISNALVIPSDAESNGFVWRIKGGKKIKTPISIGAYNDTQMQILEGLQEGDIILRLPPAGER